MSDLKYPNLATPPIKGRDKAIIGDGTTFHWQGGGGLRPRKRMKNISSWDSSQRDLINPNEESTKVYCFPFAPSQPDMKEVEFLNISSDEYSGWIGNSGVVKSEISPVAIDRFYLGTDFISYEVGSKGFNHSQSPKLLAINDEIISFTKLDDNWDGYGGIPLLESVKDVAISFLKKLDSFLLEQISDVYPNNHGTLIIDWENHKNEKLSIEFGESNFSYFVSLNNSNPKFVNGEEIFSFDKTIAEDLHNLFR